MQNSRSTNSSEKGFAFTLDMAIAVSILISASFFFIGLSSNQALGAMQTSNVAEDLLFVLENTGYVVTTLDSNSPTQAAALFRQELLSNLPEGFDANVTVRSFTLEETACAASQTFEACFPDSNIITGTAGFGAPEDFVGGSKYFLRKQPPGDCNVSFAQFEEAFWLPFENQKGVEGALFSEAHFADVNILVDFSLTVEPGDAIVCDQNVSITLGVSIPEEVRKPVDVAIVMDRSGSMSWSGHSNASSAQAIWLSGTEIFLADGAYGLRSIDVSNPRLPTEFQRVDSGTYMDVHGYGDYAFVADTYSTDELFSYNISNPSAMQLLDNIQFDTIYGVFADSGYVYVAGDGTGGGNSLGLYVYSASNPSNLSFADRVNLSGSIDVFVLGNYAYVARGGSGLSVVDISNKNNISETDTLDPGGSANGVFVSGNVAYVALGSSGLATINVGDPNNIVLLDTFNTPSNAYNVHVENGVAYVADSTSLQILDVSDPSNISLMDSFATPYTYADVAYSDGFAFLTAGSIGFVTIEIATGPRINNAQVAANTFADFNGWSAPPDQLALSTFNTTGSLNQPLTSNISLIHSAINALTASGGTDIASGIYSATSELTSARANPSALSFQVVLSDGQSNEGDSEAAAIDAVANGIIIFTVGFGEDASEIELRAIADATGGEYYYAGDQNALQDIYEIIAAKISELANDSNVSVPVINGADIIDTGGGVFGDGNLVFSAGSITPDSPWSVTYVLNFPCDNANVCGIDALTFPGEGTTFNFVGSDGNFYSIDFNASATLAFNSRDLSVDITSGEITGRNDVSLEVTVENIGELDANSTALRFYLGDTQGEILNELEVPALCSADTPSCTSFVQAYTGISIENEGVIYATINDDNSLRECPLYNIDAVNCYGGPATEVFEVEYAVWRQQT
ncbi:MAG: VWA domain-containing protein [archaeon]|nr:VWA domain-containing protein [archaeon]